MYLNVDPDLDKWMEFVSLARSEIFGTEQITVHYDEFVPDLPVEVMFVDANGKSMSIYVNEGTVEDYRMDLYSNNEMYAAAERYWKE